MQVKVKGYFQGNLGDDLFLELLCERYSEHQFIVCGWKRNKEVYSHIKNVKFIAMDGILSRIEAFLYRRFIQIIKLCNKAKSPIEYLTEEYIEQKWENKCDCNVLITGSGFCNDKDEFDTLPEKYIKEQEYYKKSPYVIGCNFGPFYYDEYYDMYKILFRSTSDLCFRDKYSANLFSSIPQSRCEADIVLAYPIERIETDNSRTDKEYMLISVANLKKDRDIASFYYDDYISFIRRVIQWNTSHNRRTVLVGFSEEQYDGDTIRSVLSGINHSENVNVALYPRESSIEILQLFSNASDVLATRYHAMILGILFKKRIYSINYNEKVGHVIDDFEPNVPRINLDDLRTITGDKLANYGFTISTERLLELRLSAERQFLELDKRMGINERR